MTVKSPTIHYASTKGPEGAVYRGPVCSKDEAIAWRRAGRDIVICGDGLAANQNTAWVIEEAAVGAGKFKQHLPHVHTAGPKALPHFQPKKRPPDGHTFFETSAQKAEP